MALSKQRNGTVGIFHNYDYISPPPSEVLKKSTEMVSKKYKA